ncbi:putative DNA polymerase [Frankliniella fusca]|uniref:DNA-directed DNA polymerase n=1 Tax=Frankliniella fusca TaxID=407009 RepID=A0AAE1HQH5_9NEOP|nr:putative DNA polymerase [Frankliniella fusca]
MTVGTTWKFIDSLSFLPMPLSAMPRSFGLQELKKGFFPFLAINHENYNYEGKMLPKADYCVTTMRSKVAAEFHDWYDDQVAKDTLFNFRQEFLAYCISDVTILRQACRAFRQLFQQTAGFDPMFSCITLSSACMAAYRRNFLQPNTIGLVPDGGYHGRGRQSHMALQWLDYESYKLGKVIKTIYTDREVSVLGRHVDGYIELHLPGGRVEKRIYQFMGDFWHNCPEHYPATKGCGENRYEQTVRLTQMFRRAGYTVIEKWECAFKHDLEYDPAVKDYFKTHPTTRVTPLRLRDALTGGRTSAMQWHCKADIAQGEKIKMVDVVSEYPSANLRGRYPVGHPTLYLPNDPNLPPVDQWNGVIKCTVLPPRDLFVPLLPYRAQGRLMFPLCRTCVENLNQDKCDHDDPADRELTDTWCAPELVMAIQEKGYTLVKVHEVYQYPSTIQFDADTGVDGLFSGYVKCFMALKLQASGWPAECKSPEEKQKYLDDIKKFDGITIDPNKVEKNGPIRSLSKLLLNSFWGKFGEKTQRPKTELIYDYGELMDLVSDPVKVVTALLPIGDNCLQVTWMPVEDADVTLPTSSLLHAAFTTCFGRLQLYKYLDIVQQRAIYCDTDSVAYLSRPGEEELPLGSHLGDLTDQIQQDYGENSYITEFIAGGPKNYSFKVAVNGDPNNIQVCIKVRGVSINSSCDDIVTFENLKEMVKGQREKVMVPIPKQIARLPPWRIVTREASKTWQALNRKRRRVDLGNTVPYGFTAWKGDDEDMEMLEMLAQLADA